MSEVLPPQTHSGSSFEKTRVPQFTVFLENRVGRLSTLMRSLEENVGKITALSIEESADSALVRVICANANASRDALRKGGFSFSETDVLAVELPTSNRAPIIAICTALLSAE
ncbi:MAG: acetolactate synthase, partial [Tepidisphaeraceae bacterium]